MTPVKPKGRNRRAHEGATVGKRLDLIVLSGFATTDLSVGDFVMLVRGRFQGKNVAAMRPFLLPSRDRSGFLELYTHAPAPLAAAERQERSDSSERGSGKENIPTLSTDALRPLMTKQQKTALNMAKFIQNQSLLLLEKPTSPDLDAEADLCEKLHDDAEHLFPYTVLGTG